MANTSLKKYYPPKQNRVETLQTNWETMKPFVKFGFKAIGIIGGALISIVKLLPMLAPEKPQQKQDKRIIKI
ncbi:hypothetical protein [Mucilaginibacter antarcticus]